MATSHQPSGNDFSRDFDSVHDTISSEIVRGGRRSGLSKPSLWNNCCAPVRLDLDERQEYTFMPILKYSKISALHSMENDVGFLPCDTIVTIHLADVDPRVADVLAAAGMADTESHEPALVPVPSFGSMGHPHNCAGPCKYANRARGCKDALSCVHCHLCVWRSDRASQRKRRAIRGAWEVKDENSEISSQ